MICQVQPWNPWPVSTNVMGNVLDDAARGVGTLCTPQGCDVLHGFLVIE